LHHAEFSRKLALKTRAIENVHLHHACDIPDHVTVEVKHRLLQSSHLNCLVHVSGRNRM